MNNYISFKREDQDYHFTREPSNRQIDVIGEEVEEQQSTQSNVPVDEVPQQNFNSVIREEETQQMETSRYVDEFESPQNLVKQKFYEKEGRYDGEFKDEMKHGKGVFDYLDGRKYEGEW